MSKHCGYIAIVGRPNVGKSTLMNAILGKSISITSRKPQTTRHRIVGIKTTGCYQALYVDTPGLHQFYQKNRLNQRMNRQALQSLIDVDLVAFMIEALRFTEADQYVLEQLKATQSSVMLLINKIDKVEKTALLPFLEIMQKKHNFCELIPVSAIRKTKILEVEHSMMSYLPVHDWRFPETMTTACSEHFLFAEWIRGPLMRHLHQELPYALAVSIESDEDFPPPKVRRISAVIWVENMNQKAIVIGKKGEKLKRIGKEARIHIEKQLKKRIYLGLWVKVKPNWTEQPNLLAQQGL